MTAFLAVVFLAVEALAVRFVGFLVVFLAGFLAVVAIVVTLLIL
jgi:hypothetical protein